MFEMLTELLDSAHRAQLTNVWSAHLIALASDGPAPSDAATTTKPTGHVHGASYEARHHRHA
jgi:hypothetical protein